VHQLAAQLSSRAGNITGLSSGGPQIDIPLSQEQGYYGLSLAVTGETAAGAPFERTFIRSVAVADIAALANNPWRLEQMMRP
ncbi:MAG: hypothetical protein KDI03_06030, partial [Anaerolineae bacterium]|nr:hypothetical protein [Anaerolineae bacterium]